MNIQSYRKEEYEKAIKQYLEYEKKENGNDVVLISIESIDNLQKAYPNYFLDVIEFVEKLDKIIN